MSFHLGDFLLLHVAVQEYPLSLDSSSHETLLKGKSISFTPNSKDSESGLDWKKVSLDNGAKIIGKKEVGNIPFLI